MPQVRPSILLATTSQRRKTEDQVDAADVVHGSSCGDLSAGIEGVKKEGNCREAATTEEEDSEVSSRSESVDPAGASANHEAAGEMKGVKSAGPPDASAVNLDDSPTEAKGVEDYSTAMMMSSFADRMTRIEEKLDALVRGLSDKT